METENGGRDAPEKAAARKTTEGAKDEGSFASRGASSKCRRFLQVLEAEERAGPEGADKTL